MSEGSAENTVSLLCEIVSVLNTKATVESFLLVFSIFMLIISFMLLCVLTALLDLQYSLSLNYSASCCSSDLMHQYTTANSVLFAC